MALPVVAMTTPWGMEEGVVVIWYAWTFPADIEVTEKERLGQGLDTVRGVLVSWDIDGTLVQCLDTVHIGARVRHSTGCTCILGYGPDLGARVR